MPGPRSTRNVARLCALLAMVGALAGGHAVALPSPVASAEALAARTLHPDASTWPALGDTDPAGADPAVGTGSRSTGGATARRPPAAAAVSSDTPSDDGGESGRTQHGWALTAAGLLALGAMSLRMNR